MQSIWAVQCDHKSGFPDVFASKGGAQIAKLGAHFEALLENCIVVSGIDGDDDVQIAVFVESVLAIGS